ncbi:MAG: efflux RND transporter permease subunit, partial [Gemmataceae bacterium]
PLGTLARVQEIGGPVMVTRYNMYNAAAVSGNPAAGISSGQAIKAIDKLARDLNVDYEWTEITYMQILAGSSGILVFFLGSLLVYFVLAAKYESWSLPASVILVVPMCLLASVVGLIIAHLDINIFVQVGFIVLVGLAAKNAILIVEFAMAQEDAGMELHAAAVDSSKQRLRPIVMTSFAFILGVVPLVITHGAGAEMRHSMGVSVFAGMLGVTGFGIFLTPVFYFVMRKWAGKKKKPGATGPAVEGDGAMTGQAGELLKAH